MYSLRKALGVLSVAILSFALMSSTASAQEDARIHLIHGIPDVAVDVAVGGDVVFEGFEFGDTQDLSSFAGQTLEGLQVLAAGTDDVAIDAGDVPLPSSGNFTVIAHLDAEGTPALAVFENDTSVIDAGEARLVVRHAAAAPEVDILANGDVAFSNVPNGAEGQADLATGTISATVVPTGASEPVVIGPADLDLVEGVSLIVYAVGSLDGDSLTVLTESIEGLATTPNQVNTGNSPVDSSNSGLLLTAVAGAAVLLAGSGLILRRTAKAAA